MEQAILDHRATHGSALFFWKSADWAPEREYRYVLFAEDDNDHFVDISRALTCVVFGSDVSQAEADNVRSALPPSVQVARMSWLNGHPNPETL